jgi:hypothetical protein
MMPARFDLRSLCRSAIALCAAACLVAAHAGCSTMGLRGGTGRLSMTSTDSEWALTPDLRTAVYTTSDIAAADIYLSDLPLERLANLDDDLSGASGSLVHIRLFLLPRAGSTPIDSTACNITLRHVIIASPGPGARPVIGVYGGGGFLLPSGSPGDRTIGGRLSEVTVRLTSSTDGFEDLFETGVVSGRFGATLNPDAANALAARVRQLDDRAAGRAPVRR